MDEPLKQTFSSSAIRSEIFTFNRHNRDTHKYNYFWSVLS